MMIMDITWLQENGKGGGATRSIQVGVFEVQKVFQNPTISHIGGENK
jgi:hypothetical protein